MLRYGKAIKASLIEVGQWSESVKMNNASPNNTQKSQIHTVSIPRRRHQDKSMILMLQCIRNVVVFVTLFLNALKNWKD